MIQLPRLLLLTLEKKKKNLTVRKASAKSHRTESCKRKTEQQPFPLTDPSASSHGRHHDQLL